MSHSSTCCQCAKQIWSNNGGKFRVFYSHKSLKARTLLQLRVQRHQVRIEAVKMAALNPSASEFRQNGPTVIMGPIKSICFMFQFNKCQHGNSHHGEDGSLQLHVCQACYELKGSLNEHKCCVPNQCSCSFFSSSLIVC